jgi:DNA repair exonuclease SbcCD nuclease subunit
MQLSNIRKIHLVGDLHLGIRNNSVEWLDIQKEFLTDFLIQKIDEDFDEARDILMLEGDIFHSRESINVRIQNEAFEIFKILSKKFKRGIYVIIGNHDVYYKDKTEVNSLKSLSHLAENIHVFESPELLTINGTHNFLMLPWIEDVTKLSNCVNDYRNICLPMHHK